MNNYSESSASIFFGGSFSTMICLAIYAKVQLLKIWWSFQGNKAQLFFSFETGIWSFRVVSASCLAHELKKAVLMPCNSQICEMSGPLILHVKIMWVTNLAKVLPRNLWECLFFFSSLDGPKKVEEDTVLFVPSYLWKIFVVLYK